MIFAKVPDAGTAKSRIAATYGPVKASGIYYELLYATAESVQGIPYHVAYTGSDNPGSLRLIFQQALSFFSQEGETLGDRLKNAFLSLFNEGYKHICAIGADCPYLSGKNISESYGLLEQGVDVVIGPAEDGGYYLIGCNRRGLPVFSARQWGSSALFKETMDIIVSNNLSHSILKPLNDIDYMEDYRVWKESLKK